ncbi:MAG: cobalamin-dependent protein [Candidatus Adiutrix sp.]|nr:cobalamin-dependent protein [Candidatus Adiutrix sp.]
MESYREIAPKADRLVEVISVLDEDEALVLARELVEVDYPGHLLVRRSLEGLKIVGRKYEEGQYFAAALVMAGEIMRQILEMINLTPAGGENSAQNETPGTVVLLGTIAGDIHDLGKDLVGEILKSHGYLVHDLGVDVAPEVFLSETISRRPDLVGISILISSSYPRLLKAVDLVRTMLPPGYRRPGVIIGGGAVNEMVFRHCQADLWCPDILKLPEVCRHWLNQAWPDPAPRSFSL